MYLSQKVLKNKPSHRKHVIPCWGGGALWPRYWLPYYDVLSIHHSNQTLGKCYLFGPHENDISVLRLCFTNKGIQGQKKKKHLYEFDRS